MLKQIWHDLVFARWPASVDHPNPLIPAGLQIDTCGGQAGIGVVPFRAAGIRLLEVRSLLRLRDDRMSLYGLLLLSAENFFPDSL